MAYDPNFYDRIRGGDSTEVRDIVHPSIWAWK